MLAGKNLKKRNNWKTSFAVLSQTKFIMYDSEADKKEKRAATLIIGGYHRSYVL